MKHYLFLFMLPILFSVSKPAKQKVVFFGDSLTEMGARPGGYIPRIDSLARLENRSADFEFVGAGVGGNKVYDLYLRMEEDLLNKNPDIVVIFIGINDVWHKSSFGTGTDVDRFERFYNAILKKLKDRNIKAILCTPSVIGERNDMSNQQDGDLNYFSGLVRNIAIKNELPLVDLRAIMIDYLKANNPENKERNILTTDRVHFNNAGNELVAESIWKKLRQQAIQ